LHTEEVAGKGRTGSSDWDESVQVCQPLGFVRDASIRWIAATVQNPRVAKVTYTVVRAAA